MPGLQVFVADFFFKKKLSKKYISYNQRRKQFGSKSGSTFYRA